MAQMSDPLGRATSEEANGARQGGHLERPTNCRGALSLLPRFVIQKAAWARLSKFTSRFTRVSVFVLALTFSQIARGCFY